MNRSTSQLATTLLTALMVAAQCVVPSLSGCACAAESSAAAESAAPKSCCSSGESTSSCGAFGTSECTCGDECGQKQTGCQCGCNSQQPTPDPVPESESPTEGQVKIAARHQSVDAWISTPNAGPISPRSRLSSELAPSSSVQVLLCTWQT